MTKIFIDAGHGGSDPGAGGHGLKEKDLTLDISKRIKKILDDYKVEVKLSRTNDATLTLPQRTHEANRWGADYLLSVHINAGGGTGYEDFIYNGKVGSKTVSLRDTMHAEITKQIPEWRNRGKKTANFHMVREAKMPAMLSESGFIDTKEDADKLKDSAFIQKLAVGHANGLIKALGLTKKQTSPKPTKPSPTPSKPSPTKPKPTKKPSTSKTPTMASSYVGKRLESKTKGLRFYSKRSWEDVDVVGTVDKGIGFPKIESRHKVGNGYQYKVTNSRGASYYITASPKFVDVQGASKPSKSVKKKNSLKVGSKVTINKSARFYSTGESIPRRVRGNTYTIMQAGRGKVLLKEIMSWVKNSDLS